MTTYAANLPSLMGQMQFYDNYIPVLHDGDYTITVTQALKGSAEAGGYDVDQSFDKTQKFTITGPRFSLDPADIHREFPPNLAQGQFSDVLPHITLTKRALPWERNVFAGNETPWLVLLVLTEDEILTPIIGSAVDSDKPNPAGASSITLNQLIAPQAAGVVVPDVGFDPYERPDEALCSVIDIAPATFQAVVPAQSDLAYLAHGRKVSVEPKSTTATVEAPGARVDAGTQWFSVIVAGRRPYAATSDDDAKTYRNVVHLVSLEGLTGYVPATPGDTVDFPSGTERVRLVSLASWTFDCLGLPAQSFADLMAGLLPGTDDAERDDLFLRLDAPALPESATPDQTYAKAALDAGYVARRYATRQGEQSFAWYRGPFAPQLPQRFEQGRRPFHVAGEAVIYDADRGLFDMSYASAFEIGRMAALHSGVMTSSLIAWRMRGRHLLDKLQHRMASTALQTLFATAPGTLQGAQLLSNALLTNRFLDYLTSDFVERVMPRISAPNPEPPQGLGDQEPMLRSLRASDPTESLRAVLETPQVTGFLQDSDDEALGPILDFLANLYLLRGVPFEYMVPDPRMLPAESVRFFYVDRNWLDSLIEGAVSVGTHTGIEAGFQAAMHGQVRTGTYALMHRVRNRLLGVSDPTVAAATDDVGAHGLSGMLIRSAVVSGWPGLEVHATDKDGNPIALIRMDHVGPQVLLCLFNGQPARVMVNEPQEGLHFGVESKDAVYLRNLTEPNPGFLVNPLQSFTASFNTERRLDVAKALADIQTGLGLSDPPGPADFAVQMVAVPERFTYAMPGVDPDADITPETQP